MFRRIWSFSRWSNGYAKNAGIKLYPFIEDRRAGGGNRKYYKPFNSKGKRAESMLDYNYSTKPLNNDNYEKDSYFSVNDIKRDDPALIKTVENLGVKSFGHCAKLKIIEIPDNIQWEISDYDGVERSKRNIILGVD